MLSDAQKYWKHIKQRKAALEAQGKLTDALLDSYILDFVTTHQDLIERAIEAECRQKPPYVADAEGNVRPALPEIDSLPNAIVLTEAALETQEAAREKFQRPIAVNGLDSLTVTLLLEAARAYLKAIKGEPNVSVNTNNKIPRAYTKPLILRRVIDGHEMVCIAPWFYEQIITCLPDEGEL